MVIDVNVGNDRIMLTAYNPRSPITMLKCIYALLRIKDSFDWIEEEEFMSWLKRKSPALYKKLEEGWEPPTNMELTVTPSNAKEEQRIVAFLLSEARGQGTRTIPRDVVKFILEGKRGDYADSKRC